MKNFLIVAFIGAGVYAVYLILTRQNGQNVVQQIPNPSGSGVSPNSYQAQQYPVQAYVPAPTPGLTFAPQDYVGPNQYYFGNGSNTVPPITQTYNLPKPVSIPWAQPNDNGAGCGCGSTCTSCISDCTNALARFPDGRGGCMAVDRKSQIKAAGGQNSPQFQNYAANLATSGADFLSILQDFKNAQDNEQPNVTPPAPQYMSSNPLSLYAAQ